MSFSHCPYFPQSVNVAYLNKLLKWIGWISVHIIYCHLQVIKMVFTLVVVFSVCWFPLHTFNLVLDFAPYLLDYIETRHEHYIFLGVYYACHWMAMANSFTNPLIFCFLNDNFKVCIVYSKVEKIKKVFICLFRRKKNFLCKQIRGLINKSLPNICNFLNL